MSIVKKPYNPGNAMFTRIMEAAKPEIQKVLEAESGMAVGQYLGRRNVIGRIEGFSLNFRHSKVSHFMHVGREFNVVAMAHIRVITNRNGLPEWATAPQLIAVEVVASEWTIIHSDDKNLIEKLRQIDSSARTRQLQDQRNSEVMQYRNKTLGNMLSDIHAKHDFYHSDSGHESDEY